VVVGVDFYFPEQNLKHRERFEESGTHTTCGWKGVFPLQSTFFSIFEAVKVSLLEVRDR
jgi:uncharacterized protein (DUF427 family)